MRIDSHQHFWIVGKFDYPWMTPNLGVLYRDYLPADFKPQLEAANIDKTVLVQASPSVAETDWFLELAAQHAWIAGVVGWLDLEAPDFAAQFDRYRTKPKFVGLRPAVEFIPDDDWLARPEVIDSLTVVAAADFPLDLIVWPRHLRAVLEVLQRLPQLRCVVDHLAKPDPTGKDRKIWSPLMAEIAQFPNVYCKLSGLPSASLEAVQPFVDHVVASFGPQRVMFGSDWPVCLRVGSYQQSIDLIRQAAKGVPERALFGETAARFYRLKLDVRDNGTAVP